MSTNPYLSLTTLAGLSSLLDSNRMMVVVDPNDGQGASTTVGSISLPEFRDNYLLVDVNAAISALQAKPGNGAFATPITLFFTGAVTGSVTFDGSTNASSVLTMPDNAIPISSVIDLASTITALENASGPASSLNSSYYSNVNGAQTTVLGYWNPSTTGIGSGSQYGTILQLSSDGTLAPSVSNYVNQLMMGTDGVLSWRQNVNNTAWNIVSVWHSGNFDPSDFVHNTGIETIAGAKTFTDVVTINAALNVTGTITLTGDMVPDVDNTRSLGTPTLQWKDVYVGPGSLYVNGQQVLSTDSSHDVVISADVDQNISIQPQGTADIMLSPQGTGGIQVKGPWVLNSGFKLLSSDGYALRIGDDFTFDTGKGFTGGLLVDANEVWHAGNFNPANYVLASGSISGNAATATALQTPRLISGVAFDGTADITIDVTVSLSNINSALATGSGPIVQTASYSTTASIITAGAMINQSTVTVTDNSSAASDVVSAALFDRFGQPTLAAVNTGVTYSNAYTVFIGGAPVAGTNVTISNSWALYINQGNTYFGGGLQVSSNVGIGTVPTAVPGTGNPVVGANNLIMYNAGDLGLTMLTDNAATRTQQIGFGSQGISLFDAGLKWDNTSRGLAFWAGNAQRALLDINGNFTATGSVSATDGFIAANGYFTKDGTHGFHIDGSNNINFNGSVLYNNSGFSIGVGTNYWAFNTDGSSTLPGNINLPNGAIIQATAGGKLFTGVGGNSWCVAPGNSTSNAFGIYDSAGTIQWTWDINQNLNTTKSMSIGSLIVSYINNFPVNQVAGPLVYESDATNHALGIRTGPSSAYRYFTFDQLGNFNALNGSVIASGAVTAGTVVSAANGFQTPTYAANTRNRIWSFGNSDNNGLSYFQGTAGLGGFDSIGVHFGTATAAGSVLNINQYGAVVSGVARITGSLSVNGGTQTIPLAVLASTGGQVFIRASGTVPTIDFVLPDNSNYTSGVMTASAFSFNVGAASFNSNITVNGTITCQTGYAVGNPAGTAYHASGSYGGGYGLVDGAYGITLYSVSGTLCFALGSNSSVSIKATLDTNGNFSTNGTVSGNRIVLGYDSGIANSLNISEWVRSSGNVGWYSSTYGGGLYMVDTTYVRTYGGKSMAAADFVVTSDKNQKKHIRDLEYRGRLIPRSFTLRETNKNSFGFVAQEVRKLYPEAVSDWNNPGEKYLSVSYNLLTAVVAHQVNALEDDLAASVKMIQKQQEQIDELQAMMKQVMTSVQKLH